MPMHLAQGAGLDAEQRPCNGFSNREIIGIRDAYAPTRAVDERFHGLHAKSVVEFRSDGRATNGLTVFLQRSGNSPGENIEALFGKSAQLGLRDIEILAKHLRRRMSEPAGK